MPSRHTIEEVFTPRNSSVNREMYQDRPDLERELKRKLQSRMNILILGESGNGKSWLYQKVLQDINIPYHVVNCSRGVVLGSLSMAIYESVVESETFFKTSYQEEKHAGLNIPIASGGLSHTGNYEKKQEDCLYKAMSHFHGQKRGKKVVILDNLEAILYSPTLLLELSNLVLLLDDPRFAKYETVFIVVGTPGNALELFSQVSNTNSFSNRISEMSKVGSLTHDQTSGMIQKGFSLLGMSFTQPDTEFIIEHIYYVTLGVAQRVHEYCMELAHQIQEKNDGFSGQLLDEADLCWLKGSLRKNYQLIESHLNSIETTIARRNQVIYALGLTSGHDFSARTINSIVRTQFPDTIPKTNTGIGAIMTALASGPQPLIRRRSGSRNYYFADPMIKMCIRLVITRKLSGKVEIKKFGL